MAKIIDITTRRPPHDQRRKDERTAELRDAFRSAREDADADSAGQKQSRATRKLLDLYRTRAPKNS